MSKGNRSKRSSTVTQPSASKTPPPSTPAGESMEDLQDAPKPTTFTGACVEMVSKRLRAFRKKLTKIERTETQSPSELNKDQLEAIQKKPEVAAVAKELDEIVKQLAAAESEEVQDKEAREASRRAELSDAVKTAEEEAKHEARRNMQQALRYIHALSCVLPNISSVPVQLTEKQFAALTRMNAVVCGTSETSNDGMSAFVNTATTTLEKLLANSDSVFYDGVTYADLASLLSLILSPPAPPQFGLIGEVDEVDDLTGGIGANEPTHGQNEPPAFVYSKQTPAFSGTGITFLNPSEVENGEQPAQRASLYTSLAMMELFD
ncbi:hypothetical protein HK101_003365 [Irineochytrium annulatum]|nr:hypothetical protein HK101_003365 [Irineochytrium annulatum]